MRICKSCKGTDIKSRKNYSHGSKSKAMITYTCKKCGSNNIETKEDPRNKRRQRK
ncbi:hypothetical protein HN587_03540 [Candidatus Woesearchaeota archaeon]|jgi:hypothetical protein|nr:hypothetical protein [Candidatus Woesearchaeota archaeon]